MFLRILRPYEAGSYRAGLVGILFPANGHRSFLEKTAVGDDVSSDPIVNSQLLVTIREPNRSTLSYHLDGYNVSRVLDSTEYVTTAPEPTFVVPRRRRRLAWLWISLASVLIALFTLLGLAGWLGWFSMRVVLTGSMQPSINPGDVIITLNDNIKSPQVGDVVVYTGKTFDGKPVAPFAHRIIGGNAIDGWVVKGDNNIDADVQQPTSVDIESVVVGAVPAIGRFLNVQFLILVAAVVFGTWLIIDGVRGRK